MRKTILGCDRCKNEPVDELIEVGTYCDIALNGKLLKLEERRDCQFKGEKYINNDPSCKNELCEKCFKELKEWLDG